MYIFTSIESLIVTSKDCYLKAAKVPSENFFFKNFAINDQCHFVIIFKCSLNFVLLFQTANFPLPQYYYIEAIKVKTNGFTVLFFFELQIFLHLNIIKLKDEVK